MKRREFIELTSASFIGSYLLSNKQKITNKQLSFIWYDAQNQGRNLYGLFRRYFEIDQKIISAIFRLFADTFYQLFINGKFIEFGPVRFDPRFPVYDTHDIIRHLQPGKNVIAIRVNYFGHKTFKSILSQGGWIGWGNIALANGKIISLDTKQGNWLAHPDQSHWRYASKMSFALNTAEIFDQSQEEKNWTDIVFDDQHWSEAIQLKETNSWGILKPRSIPYMSGKLISISKVLHVLPLTKEEEWYSFYVPVPHFFEDNKQEFSNFIAFTTFIYSPVKQELRVGVFWGDYWLNGQKVAEGVTSVNKSMRINQMWSLEQGWNYLFGKVDAYYDVLYQYSAFPRGKGVIVSAEPSFDSIYSFKHSPVLKIAEFDQYLKHLSLPYSAEEKLSGIGGWILVAKNDIAHSSCRETSWDDYGEILENITPETLPDHIFSREYYPDGFSLLMELDYTHLVFPRIQLEGVSGAIVDVTYSETINPDHLHLNHSHHYSLGDRLLCSRNDLDWFPTHPRGFKYLKVTVRHPQNDIKIKSISLRSSNYPVTTKGWFKCSDPLFNEIWLMGERTLAINMEDVFTDTPSRERCMYIRDVVIQYHVNLATFGDRALMNRCLELFAQSPDTTGKFRVVYPNTGNYTLTDFALNILEGYQAYYENTGDKQRLLTDWDAIINNLQWFNDLADKRTDLLLDADWYIHQNISDVQDGFFGDIQILPNYLDKTGVNCLFSCTYLLALKIALFLAQIIGKNQEADLFKRRIKILNQTIPQNFWNAEKGCFSDNLSNQTFSIHSNMFAIRAGVVNSSQLESLKKYFSCELKSIFLNGFDPSDGYFISPSFAFYILDGLYKCGLEKIAENIIRQGWGWVLSQGLKTCPEYFNLKSSHSHAWSASPTYYLSKYVLGVHFPQAPNLDLVAIKVQSHSITEAEGAFPHPKGLIEVKWHTEQGKIIFDFVKVPKGVTLKFL